jgi:hypothetical protein
MSNENEIIEENYYECLYCGATFDTEEERDAHTFEKHMDAVEEKLGEISELAQEHKQTIQEWKDEKRKEILSRLSQENPQALRMIQNSPHSDEMLNKLIEMDLFKLALRTQTLNSDIVWIKSPHFEEVYEAERRKPKHYNDPQSGQSEQTIPIDSPNDPAKKVLETATPINRVSFKSGKLILQPLSKDSLEQLSDKDKSLMILYSLLRKKKKE